MFPYKIGVGVALSLVVFLFVILTIVFVTILIYRQKRTHGRHENLMEVNIQACKHQTITLLDPTHHMVISQPFAHINSFLYSFIPNSISLWNKLSEEQVSAASLQAFKELL